MKQKKAARAAFSLLISRRWSRLNIEIDRGWFEGMKGSYDSGFVRVKKGIFPIVRPDLMNYIRL